MRLLQFNIHDCGDSHASLPYPRVLVVSGYTDLATPYAANYTFAHIGPRSPMDQVTMTYYDAGHMHYSHEPSRRKLRDDIVKFMATTQAVAEKK